MTGGVDVGGGVRSDSIPRLLPSGSGLLVDVCRNININN